MTVHETPVPRPLDGRVALVTGAARGIGAASARALHRAGAAVVLAARSADALEALADEITKDGGRALAVPTDVTDPLAVERLVARTCDTYGRLDAAVNNAAGGGHPPTPLAEVDVADFDSAFAVNLRGVFLAMKYEIPAMLASGGGAIVNMSSTAGLQAVGGLAGYVSTKFGLVGLTRVAALDYADAGIRINALAPGPIHTEQLERAGEQARSMAAAAMPMRRIGQPEEVAEAVVWLCSDASSFVTGATLPIDGGKLSGTPPFRRPGA
ncbi:SDR family NAD(P)-dependent oxidoreductase [Uniformispora flossi]|uniref:SDR family NAD(P)-dependent oxidoreductase n=1 Tax=Uniformispora flossi TaxID=3390723 RepID=UPI003C2F6CDB